MQEGSSALRLDVPGEEFALMKVLVYCTKMQSAVGSYDRSAERGFDEDCSLSSIAEDEIDWRGTFTG